LKQPAADAQPLKRVPGVFDGTLEDRIARARRRPVMRLLEQQPYPGAIKKAHVPIAVELS